VAVVENMHRGYGTVAVVENRHRDMGQWQ
jgi:hypothetical protein